MTGLPKIVRDRLGRAAGGASALDHPDANLLTGFVERSLTERERGLVLGHLVQCAQCREQVSLALPKLEAEMAGVGGGVVRGWLRWPVLRWGLLVASLAIMGTVALVRQPPARRMELASRANVEAPPSAASLPSDITVGAAPAKAARPASPPGTGLTKRKPQNNDELALRFEATAQKAAPNRKVVPPQLKQKVLSYEASLTSKAPMAPSAPAQAPNASPNAIELGSSNQTSNAAVARALPPPAATAPITPTQGQPAHQALDFLPSPQSKQTPTAHAPEGEPVPGQVPGSAKSSPQLADSLATPRPPQATLFKHAPPAVSPTTSGALASSPFTADWSISASGKVQRSRDGRKSWEELDVDKNVVFRVVSAVGPDVWLGGSKGALYHSSDGGQHWTRVNITTGSTTVTDDVIHIEFKDARHGTVGTAAGDSWTTSDTGEHWQKQDKF